MNCGFLELALSNKLLLTFARSYLTKKKSFQ